MEKCTCNGRSCGKSHDLPLFPHASNGCPNDRWHKKSGMCQSCFVASNRVMIEAMQQKRRERSAARKAAIEARIREINTKNQIELPINEEV